MSYPAKSYELLMSFVSVDWLVNDIVELELSFLYKYLSLERTDRAKYVSKTIQHFALISHLYKRSRFTNAYNRPCSLAINQTLLTPAA